MDDNQKQRLAELLNEEPGKNKGKGKDKDKDKDKE
jgi:hypothetical protein